MKVAILGTGLMGGSIGLALKRADPTHEITAFDRDPAAATEAVARGAADRAAASATEAVADAELVFVAAPVSIIPSLVKEVAPALRTGALITDVGSTKSRVVVEVESWLPEGVAFIGGHPMAGSEDDGIGSARDDLFADAWWILTPTERSSAEDYRRLHALLATLRARVMALAPAEHDELMALISHVPQLTATALMNMAADRGKEHAGLLALAAGGFRDVTRVAASNPEIWLDICAENREALVGALGDFAGRLLELRDAVDRGDREALRAALEAGRQARRTLPGKAVEGDAWEVRMPIPDRPGVLAQVTTLIGNLGVNIEDLQISHSAEGGRGVLHLVVSGQEQARKVVEALLKLGFEPREDRR
jgi:prephenate dehydrogenase